MLCAMFAQFSDRLHSGLCIREEVAAGGLKHRSKHSAPELGVHPLLGKLEPLGELRHRQTTGDHRPASSLSQLHTMANADAPNRAGEDLRATPWRTMSFCG